MANVMDDTLARGEQDNSEAIEIIDFGKIEGEADDDFQIELAADDEPAEEPPAEVEAESEAEPEDTPEEDEEDEEVVGEIEAPDDEEYLSFPKKVQNRIFREVRAKHRIQQELLTERRAREQAIPVIQRIVAEKQQNDARLGELETAYADLLGNSLEREITFKQRELKAAKDDGDTEAEIKVSSELQELVFNHRKAKEFKEAIASRKTQPAPQPQAQQVQQPVQQQNPLVSKWVGKNKAWYGSAKFAAETAATQAIDQQLTSEGYDQNTAEYFAELDRRINKKFPSLRKKPAAVTNSGNKQTVAGVSQGAPSASSVGKNKVVLTKSDLALMRSLGMDPANKEHLKAFASQRVKAA